MPIKIKVKQDKPTEKINNNERYTLYKGDCLEHMKNIPDNSVNLVLCDLPYGTTKCKWDTIIDMEKLWERHGKSDGHSDGQVMGQR